MAQHSEAMPMTHTTRTVWHLMIDMVCVFCSKLNWQRTSSIEWPYLTWSNQPIFHNLRKGNEILTKEIVDYLQSMLMSRGWCRLRSNCLLYIAASFVIVIGLSCCNSRSTHRHLCSKSTNSFVYCTVPYRKRQQSTHLKTYKTIIVTILRRTCRWKTIWMKL